MMNLVPFLLLSLLTACYTEADHAAEVNDWRAQREEGLRAPDSWLTLVGLFWLDDGEHTFGSAPENDLVFPEKAPAYIGRFLVKGGTVSAILADAPADTILLESDHAVGGPTIQEAGSFSWYVVDREGRPAVRLKDSQSPALAAFDGMENFEIDRRWRFEGRFDSYDPPRKIPIPTILGTEISETSPGAIVFEFDGETYRLDVTGEPGDERYFVMFADATNGRETYPAGRYLYIDAPGTDGRAVIDFNKAYNPPCVFSAYATCPFPPPQNRLPIAVTAGEKVYEKGKTALSQGRMLEERMYLLRTGSTPEWAEFARPPDAQELVFRFSAEQNRTEQTFFLRQRDVKHQWRVSLNGQPLGLLTSDEKFVTRYLPVPSGTLRGGENSLRIEQSGGPFDDVLVGHFVLIDRPLDDVLSEGAVAVEVVGEDGQGMPSRITIVGEDGVLQTPGAVSGNELAVRTGFVYTATGTAEFGLPAGSYTLYATRGFEYGVDSTRVEVRKGETSHRRLELLREVPTDGWIAMDPHVHTFTFSGHGDATVEERVLTIAGEGIELPVLTDHNVHVDIEPVAVAMGMRRYYTPVVGNEVTTQIGHFNIFPVDPNAAPPVHDVADWREVARQVAGFPAVILNHGRDIHRGFRPFGAARHLAVAGSSRDGWVLPAGAMEVINSGSTQTYPLQLLDDWLGLLNRGHILTPVGSSDAHDVGRYFIGQGRTYVRAKDGDPGRIDVSEVVESFRSGRVMVSLGLLAEIVVDGAYGPGELAPASDEVAVTVRVLGPDWARAERVALYQNGRMVREAEVADGGAAGLKAEYTWTLPRPGHDVHLVVIAEGPGDGLPFWPIEKPYQPASPEWTPRLIGLSGAVWIDADGDGRRSSAFDYAARLVDQVGEDVNAVIGALARYDEAVAVQAAVLLAEKGLNLGAAALSDASPETRRGFAAVAEGLRASR